MTVTILEAQMADFLRSSFGPVGRDLAARADSVYSDAAVNANEVVIGVRTQDLLNSLFARIEQDADGLIAKVGATAVHRGFAYPAFVHRAGDRPGAWLRGALATGYEDGINARSR